MTFNAKWCIQTIFERYFEAVGHQGQ